VGNQQIQSESTCADPNIMRWQNSPEKDRGSNLPCLPKGLAKKATDGKHAILHAILAR
jgi:hypothetical protein